LLVNGRVQLDPQRVTKEMDILRQTLRELSAQQDLFAAAEEDRPAASRLAREDLHLVCFEYICS
jgi:hypothetical protein